MIKICKKHNVASGIHLGGVDALKRWIKEGMRLIVVSNDISMIVDIEAKLVRGLREFLENK